MEVIPSLQSGSESSTQNPESNEIYRDGDNASNSHQECGPTEVVEETAVVQKRGRGRPPKYSDEERKVVRAQQARENALRYYHIHREQVNQRSHDYYWSHIPQFQGYYKSRVAAD